MSNYITKHISLRFLWEDCPCAKCKVGHILRYALFLFSSIYTSPAHAGLMCGHSLSITFFLTGHQLFFSDFIETLSACRFVAY